MKLIDLIIKYSSYGFATLLVVRIFYDDHWLTGIFYFLLSIWTFGIWLKSKARSSCMSHNETNTLRAMCLITACICFVFGLLYFVLF